METTGDRIEQFKSEVTDLNLKTGNPSREKTFQTIGFLLMLAGIIGGIICYVGAKNASGTADLAATKIQEQIVFSIWFLILTVVGAAMFLRYALASFLRMWLLRQLYEGQANTDRIVDAFSKR